MNELISVESRDRIRAKAEAWGGYLWTKEELVAQGYILGWIPEEFHDKPDAFPRGTMFPDPHGGPNQVVYSRPNPFQLILVAWDKIPPAQGQKPC